MRAKSVGNVAKSAGRITALELPQRRSGDDDDATSAGKQTFRVSQAARQLASCPAPTSLSPAEKCSALYNEAPFKQQQSTNETF